MSVYIDYVFDLRYYFLKIYRNDAGDMENGVFKRLIDKLIFGVALLGALQTPILLAHYQQFLSGQYDVLGALMNDYQENAVAHGYSGAGAMIEHHAQNEVASVRADAELKREQLTQFDALSTGMKVFSQGNLLQKVWYVFQPKRFATLQKVTANFKPGLPLTIETLVFAFVIALLVSWLVTLPFVLLRHLLMPTKRSRARAI